MEYMMDDERCTMDDVCMMVNCSYMHLIMYMCVPYVASFLTFSYLADTYYRSTHPHTHPKFPAGSVHEHIQSSLRTGDIVLFQRNPYTYRVSEGGMGMGCVGMEHGEMINDVCDMNI